MQIKISNSANIKIYKIKIYIKYKIMNKISILFVCFCIVSLIVGGYNKPLDPKKILVALNCGSKTQQVSTSEGNFKYVPDQSFVKGSSVDVDYHNDAGANEAQIKFTLDKQVYMFQRHTYQQMTYELPVKKGKHTIIMKFAEMYFKNKGQRVFNIKLGSKIVIQNFDVIQKSGSKYAAHQQYIQIDVRPNGVYYNNAHIPSAIENGKLKLSFIKAKADNPIVQAIIVYQDSIQNSPKAEFLSIKSKWNSQQQMLKAKKQQKELREQIAIQKKKQRIVFRNDQLVVEQQQKSGTQTPSAPQQKYGMIRSLLMSPIGVVFWCVALFYLVNFIKSNIFKVEKMQKIKSQQLK